MHILVAVVVAIYAIVSVQRRPLGLIFEKAHCLDVLWVVVSILGMVLKCSTTPVRFVRGEAVVDAGGENEQIVLRSGVSVLSA